MAAGTVSGRRPIGVGALDDLAVRVSRQLLRAEDELAPGHVVGRLRHVEPLEEVTVVVDDEARDVLGQARDRAVPAEGVNGLLEEVVERERVRVLDVGLERLEHVARRELAVEAVVHEEEVGRRAAGERGREAGDQILAVARLDELDVDVRLLLGERADHRL